MGDKVICLQNSSTILAELVLEVQNDVVIISEG